MKKYELTKESKVMPNGNEVYRIRALIDFDTIIGRRVNKGDLGGWVSSEANLCHDHTCWLFDDAVNSGNSRRSDKSVGCGKSWSYENSIQSKKSRQSGYSWQSGWSWQSGNSQQSGHSWQSGWSWQSGNSQQSGNSRQSGNSQQSSVSNQSGNVIHVEGKDCEQDVICVGPFGNHNRYVSIQPTGRIAAGCFIGDFTEFKDKVSEKYGDNYGGYKNAIIMIDALFRAKE